MDNDEILNKVNKFARCVIENYDPEKIILFGSFAKGNARDDSDIDIAIIVNAIDGNFLEHKAKLFKLRREIDEMIEPVLLEANNDKSGFLTEILRHGKIIYQKRKE